MTTPAEAARRLGKAAASVAGPGSEKALNAAGIEAKNVMGRAGERLSGYGRRSRRGHVDPKARYEPQAGLRVVVEPTKATKGLWALLEHGSGAQWRFPRRRGARRRTGTYTREQVRARHSWSRAVPRAADEAFRAYHRNVVQSVFRDLRGG